MSRLLQIPPFQGLVRRRSQISVRIVVQHGLQVYLAPVYLFHRLEHRLPQCFYLRQRNAPQTAVPHLGQQLVGSSLIVFFPAVGTEGLHSFQYLPCFLEQAPVHLFHYLAALPADKPNTFYSHPLCAIRKQTLDCIVKSFPL